MSIVYYIAPEQVAEFKHLYQTSSLRPNMKVNYVVQEDPLLYPVNKLRNMAIAQDSFLPVGHGRVAVSYCFPISIPCSLDIPCDYHTPQIRSRRRPSRDHRSRLPDIHGEVFQL